MRLNCFIVIVSIVQLLAHVDNLNELLLRGISDKVYTGVVAIAGTKQSKFTYASSFGHQSYLTEDKNSPKVTFDEYFDIASLTKVIATTTAVGLLYQNGYLSLDSVVADVLDPDFARCGKENVTILNCLLHNSGLSPDPTPWYWDAAFRCPNTLDDLPAEDFSCVDKIYKSIMNETLQQPPGQAYVYSDIGFETVQMVVGAILHKNSLVDHASLNEDCTAAMNSSSTYSTMGVTYICLFEAFVRVNVFSNTLLDKSAELFSKPMPWLQNTSYKLSSDKKAHCMPTLNDTGEGSYLHKRLQGEVSDGDCYAMGGVAGHAGVFSTAPDIAKFLMRMLALSDVDNTAEQLVYYNTVTGEYQVQPMATHDAAIVRVNWLNSTTVKKFTTEFNHSLSSRALGWTTNDPEVADYGFNQSCGTMSELTFMHTGYSGTCMCVDPVKKLWSVVLTNRAYNCQGQLCPPGGSNPVKAIWKEFNTIIVEMSANIDF